MTDTTLAEDTAAFVKATARLNKRINAETPYGTEFYDHAQDALDTARKATGFKAVNDAKPPDQDEDEGCEVCPTCGGCQNPLTCKSTRHPHASCDRITRCTCDDRPPGPAGGA